MRTTRTLFIFGVWVAILPYLGFPYFVKNILFTCTGILIIGVSFSMYREVKRRQKENGEGGFDNFRENSEWVEQPSGYTGEYERMIITEVSE